MEWVARGGGRDCAAAVRWETHAMPEAGAPATGRHQPAACRGMRAGHAGVEGGRDQVTRDRRLGREHGRCRNRGLRAARAIFGPSLEQIEPPIDQRMTPAARVGEEHSPARDLSAENFSLKCSKLSGADHKRRPGTLGTRIVPPVRRLGEKSEALPEALQGHAKGLGYGRPNGTPARTVCTGFSQRSPRR